VKLTEDLPKWIAWPLRLTLYVFVMFILYNITLGMVKGRAMNNAMECTNVTSAKEGSLKYAKSMVTCMRQKNGFLENLLMDSVFRAVDAMPNVPKEFVGTWAAAQPRCNYRHKLEENGEFTSEPQGCSLSSEIFHGAWGVYGNQMIWMPDNGAAWPPDINPMDVVDKDFFLLVEKDGSRTKFARVATEAKQLQAVQDPGSTVSGLQMLPSPANSVVISDQLEERHVDNVYPFALNLEEHNLTVPADKEFNKAVIHREEELNNLLPAELMEKVRSVVGKHACNLYPFQVYFKRGIQEKIIETSCHDSKYSWSDYPVMVVVSANAVRELVGMNKFGFMHQSGGLKAVTGMNSNGRLELWLAGAVCECHGDGNEPCDCTGTTRIEVE
jgi:hypothetical protein